MDGGAIVGVDSALALLVESLAAGAVVVAVDFATHVVVTQLVGGYAAALTAHHGVENYPPLVGELLQ